MNSINNSNIVNDMVANFDIIECTNELPEYIENEKYKYINLSTMTIDAMVTNVRYNKETAIEHLMLTDKIVEIGCNFGHKISEKYKDMDFYKKRIKEQKLKNNIDEENVTDQRKRQGLGTHFNSQITFTVLSNIPRNYKIYENEKNKKLYTYQVKLFTNGRVQIPGIGAYNQNLIINDLFNSIIKYIRIHEDVLVFRKNLPITIKEVIPILKNYTAKSLEEDDCICPKQTFNTKKNEKFYKTPFIDLTTLENIISKKKKELKLDIYINCAIFTSQRYAAMRIKFSTPHINILEINENKLKKDIAKINNCSEDDIERLKDKALYNINKLSEIVKLYYQQNNKNIKIKPVMLPDEIPTKQSSTEEKMEYIIKLLKNTWANNTKTFKKSKPKQTTVKLFKSGKINIDHANNSKQAIIIRDIVVYFIKTYLDEILYYECIVPKKEFRSILAIKDINEDINEN